LKGLDEVFRITDPDQAAAYLLLGDPQQARTFSLEALALYRRTGDGLTDSLETTMARCVPESSLTARLAVGASSPASIWRLFLL
jgi:hypothetical protein